MPPILAVVGMLGGLVIATQVFARMHGYAPELGANWNHVYPPWAILGWAVRWYRSAPDSITQAGSIGAVFTALVFFGIAIYSQIARSALRTLASLHGSARWADRNDIKRAGLLASSESFDPTSNRVPPVYVGAWSDRGGGKTEYLRHSGAEHVLVIAPTRSGKGVGLVLPTLLSWPQSTFVTDLKGELWELTAGWRSKFAKNTVLRFEPASRRSSVRWNPLDEIRIGSEHEVGDAQNLATLIVDPDGKGLEGHWEKTAQALLVGMILHVLYKRVNEGVPASLPVIDDELSNPERGIRDLWAEMGSYAHVDGHTHPVVAAAARDQLDRPEEEAGSVLSTTKSYLSLYRDPTIRANTTESDFRVRDLMQSDNPMSLYVVTQPSDKARMRSLVRILTNMVIRVNASGLTFANGQPRANYKHRALLMLDEFPALGKLEILQESLAFLAGYGIKCYLICQDLTQLRSKEIGYGPDETVTSNCHIQIAFPPNRIETAEYLSKMTGLTTVTREKVTTSGARTALLQNHVAITTEETQRHLLTADECLRMPGPKKDEQGMILEPGDMLVFASGYPAMYGRQPLYFLDKTFSARSQIPAPDANAARSREPVTVSL